jgi:hypothetical protein
MTNLETGAKVQELGPGLFELIEALAQRPHAAEIKVLISFIG